MKRTIFILLIIAIVFTLAFYLSKFIDDNNIEIVKPVNKGDVIVVASPIKDSEISSPLSIAGRAKGTWFSDGSFPILLVDSYGNTVAEGHVTVQGEVSPKEFVKFIGNLQFSNYIKGSKGELILKKSNSSGLKENDDSITIPIIFK